MNPSMTYGQPLSGQSVTVAYTGTAGTTTAMPPGTKAVRVISTTDCFIEVTNNAGVTAVANTGLYLPALTPEYFICGVNAKVSAVQVSAGGSLYVTPFV